MELRTIKQALMGITGLATLLAIVILGWSVVGGRQQFELSTEVPTLPPDPSADPTVSGTRSRNFDALWGMSVKEAVAPQNMAAVDPVEVAVKPPFAIQLIGTLVQANQAIGIFRDQAGGFDAKGSGESLALVPQGVEIEAIEPGIAKVKYEGKAITLELTSTPAIPPSPTSTSTAAPAPPPSLSNAGQPTNTPTAAPPAAAPMPIDFATGNESNAVPAGEEDIFAPLPAMLDPSRGTEPLGSPEPQPPGDGGTR